MTRIRQFEIQNKNFSGAPPQKIFLGGAPRLQVLNPPLASAVSVNL